MTIETRFSIGDTVFYMQDNRVQKGIISTVSVRASGNYRRDGEIAEKIVSYGLYDGNNASDIANYGGHRLFSSKEELLASL